MYTTYAKPDTLIGAALAPLEPLAIAPEVAQAQNAKLRLERFAFDALPDVKIYISYVENDGTVIGGRAATDFKLTALPNIGDREFTTRLDEHMNDMPLTCAAAKIS